jgi:hypothetical protein
LLLIGQQGMGHFFVLALASHLLEDCAYCANARENDKYIANYTTIQASSQSTFYQ